jgi:hypothetical protein
MNSFSVYSHKWGIDKFTWSDEAFVDFIFGGLFACVNWLIYLKKILFKLVYVWYHC